MKTQLVKEEGSKLMAERNQTFLSCSHAAVPPPALRFERVIDAPRERVFKAWTEPQQMMRWWAPAGFAATFCAVDLRPRGRWSICMQSSEGIEYRTEGIYREVCEPETLVMSLTWQESPIDAPCESTVALSFAEEGDKTRFTFEQTFVDSDLS